jgi:hypothetical protein
MPQDEPGMLDAAMLRDLAALAGVDLGEDRAAALVAQAEPHFTQLRQLAAAANAVDEPAAVFRLDPPEIPDGG